MMVEPVHERPVAADDHIDLAVELPSALERALAFGGRPVHRLGSAGTSVTFAVVADPTAVTLLLDRHPPVVRGGEDPAEITIELSREQALCFLRGELKLPTEILSGTVTFRGPVRRYLGFDPVLRALLARGAGREA